MSKRTKGILSTLGILMLIIYLVSMSSNEAGSVLVTPFGVIVFIGYICLIVGLAKQRIWALGILLILILATSLMTAIFAEVSGIGNILESSAVMFFFMSLFILPVFGISAVVRRIIKRKKPSFSQQKENKENSDKQFKVKW